MSRLSPPKVPREARSSAAPEDCFFNGCRLMTFQPPEAEDRRRWDDHGHNRGKVRGATPAQLRGQSCPGQSDLCGQFKMRVVGQQATPPTITPQPPICKSVVSPSSHMSQKRLPKFNQNPEGLQRLLEEMDRGSLGNSIPLIVKV